ncbi:MAG TPA: LysR substrate-binding domain-containing protein, partial [Blastocatellia bacterium]|nr:LysR substrate-binding domain-containing protein [Blastocatellia bacterium]
EDDIRAMASNREGILRISTECYTCYHWLPGILKLFAQSFAGIEVRIVAEATRRPVEALLDGKIDLAITSSHVRNSKMSFKPLFKDELVVVMATDHDLSSRPWISAHDFTSQHLITYALPKEELTFFKKVLIPSGVSPRKISRIELTEAIIEMVKAGLGISVMARWAVAPFLSSGSLRAVPLTKRGQHRQWYGATLKAAKSLAYVSKFIELAGELNLNAGFEADRRGS